MSQPVRIPLRVNFTVSVAGDLPDLQRIQSLLEFVAHAEGITGEIGIWLCTDDEIADLHLRFMNIPGATDVITFSEIPVSAGFLGDIAVSVETASGQATDVGHTPNREVAYLCLHGLLHIAGHDDLDDSARSSMTDRQDELLASFEQENPGEW